MGETPSSLLKFNLLMSAVPLLLTVPPVNIKVVYSAKAAKQTTTARVVPELELKNAQLKAQAVLDSLPAKRSTPARVTTLLQRPVQDRSVAARRYRGDEDKWTNGVME